MLQMGEGRYACEGPLESVRTTAHYKELGNRHQNPISLTDPLSSHSAGLARDYHRMTVHCIPMRKAGRTVERGAETAFSLLENRKERQKMKSDIKLKRLHKCHS
jgi:hypothetical protein